jgi:hypothetical protein
MALLSLGLIILLVLCTVSASVSSSPPVACDQTNQWYSFTASFGKKSGNTTILQKDIDNFVETEVMPKIDGFKLVEAKGVWKGQTEDSFDIVVLSNEFSKMWKKLQNISLLYKTKFAQDSVLLFYDTLCKVVFL